MGLQRLHGAQGHVVILGDHAIDALGVGVEPVFGERHGLGAVPVGGFLFDDLDVRVFAQHFQLAFFPVDLRRLANRALDDHHVALAIELVDHGLGLQAAAFHVVVTHIRHAGIGYFRIGGDDHHVVAHGGLDGTDAGLGINRYEQNRVVALGHHVFDLVVLGQGVVVAVEHGQLHGAILDGRMFLELADPVLHELTLEAIDGCADLVGLAVGGQGDTAGEQGEGRRSGQGGTQFHK